MTYKQIEQIESFIKEVNELKEDTAIAHKVLYERGRTLHEKFSASNVGYMVAVNWNNCAFFGYAGNSTTYFVDKIKSNLEVMLSALKGILDAIPQYSYILEVRKDIARGRKIKKADKHNFIAEIVVKYQGKIDFGKVIQDYLKEDNMLSWSIEDTSYFNGIIQKLELYLVEICEEKKTAKRQTQEKQTVVNVNQNVNQNQETNVNVTISFEDCFKALDDCETLNDTETQEIKKQLQEIQELLKDKKGKKKSIKSKIANILKWVAEKGTDVMIAVLPVLLQSLQGLQ
ncbi:MAG: hypothetical protein J6C23_00915 [Clostridia bacterium]|nr:hypothetical protein [Clostridia bacterium]